MVVVDSQESSEPESTLETEVDVSKEDIAEDEEEEDTPEKKPPLR